MSLIGEYAPDVTYTDRKRIQHRGVFIGDRSQFEDLSLEEYIADRDMMSTPRRDLQYPEWTEDGLNKM